MNHLESKLQSEIVKYLRQKDICFFCVPNEAGKSALHTARLKAMGLKAGVSDLILLFKKKTVVFCEIKTEIGKQSPSQKGFEAEVLNLGFEYIIVRSVEDIQKAVEYYVNN